MKYTPCTCNAYRHPHRPMSGDCHRHNLADCPSQIVIPDPYGTGDHWYRWVEHGRKLKPGESIHA